MEQGFEHHWRQARALENQGQAEAAKDIYERLIADDPTRLYVRLRLSAIEQKAGNYLGAREHALRCAEDVRSSRWNDLAAVTLRLLSFDEWSLVRELINCVDWTHPDVVRHAAVLSQHLWLIGDVADSLRLIDTALEKVQGSALLHYSRATTLGYLGRMTEATEDYERCLAITPHDPYAHWSLAHHEKASPPGSRIQRIRRTQTLFPPDAPEQPYLDYALFKEFDHAGDVEQAWWHLARGASTKRRQVRYDPNVEDAGFETLRDTVDSRFVSGHVASAERPHLPIFIVGMPRSGTTLLERILGSHADVASGGELHAFSRALCIESNQFLAPYIRPATIQRLGGSDFSAVGRRYLQQTAAWNQGKRFLIDKNPANFVHAGFIARALPQARIVCLRRSPMDACMSNFKHLFSNEAYGYSYELDDLAEYYGRFDRLCSHWREVLGGRFLEVQYEELVGAPSMAARQVMAHCGLTFESASVDITRNTSPVTTASSSQVREPIHARGIGAWRKYEAWLEPLRSKLETRLGRPC